MEETIISWAGFCALLMRCKKEENTAFVNPWVRLVVTERRTAGPGLMVATRAMLENNSQVESSIIHPYERLAVDRVPVRVAACRVLIPLTCLQVKC